MIDSVNIDSNTTIYFGDCLEVMPSLASQDITGNLILADIPFGTTNCKWNSIISLEGMWQCLDQITLPNTPILLFAQQPFTSILGSSNIKNLRYNWVWEKTQGTGFLNAKRIPLKCHEGILQINSKINMQKKLYKWQREELTKRRRISSCDYPADLESVMALLPDYVELAGDVFQLVITPGYVRYVPYRNKGETGYSPKDIHDIDTMLCKSEDKKAKSPTTLDACWQVLVTLNDMWIVPNNELKQERYEHEAK